MSFFQRQERARGMSRRLVMLFSLAVVLIVVAISTIVGLAAVFASEDNQKQIARGASMLMMLREHWPVALGAGVVTALFIGIASLIRIAMLKRGGGVVAEKLGGTRVPSDTQDLKLRRLLNVVEEMSIAAGMPVPEVYVLEGEPGINAFAAGFGTSDAAVAVTRGSLDLLSRDELQGVIAHEFSHILNGDMRLNLRLMGLLFGILALAVAARTVLRHSRGGRGRDGAPIMAIALAIMVIGYIGVFFGRLIKAGVSRQREYLADASAVQFTRDNQGISGALKKIAALSHGSQLQAADGEEVAHMLFGDGVGYSSLFATHPPLLERIRSIQPNFNEAELADIGREMDRLRARAADAAQAETEAEEAGLSGAKSGLPGGFNLPGMPDAVAGPAGGVGAVLAGAILAATSPAASSASGSAPAPEPGAAPAAATAPPASPPRERLTGSGQSVNALAAVARAGSIGEEEMAYARLIRDQMPPVLREAARRPDQCVALVLALLVHSAEHDGERALGLLRAAAGDDLERSVKALLPAFAELHPAQRTPLASLAFPGLRRLSRPDVDQLMELVVELIHLDGEVSVFEYCLGKELLVHLVEARNPSRTRAFGNLRLASARGDFAAVLSVLAHLGHPTEVAARRAYLAGLNSALPDATEAYAPPADWKDSLDQALATLDRLEPRGKDLLVEAMVATLRHDGVVTVEEGEVLRAVCAVLHVPLPPLLSSAPRAA